MGAAILTASFWVHFHRSALWGVSDLSLSGKRGVCTIIKDQNIDSHDSSKLKKPVFINKYTYIFYIWRIWMESDPPAQCKSAFSRYKQLGVDLDMNSRPKRKHDVALIKE